MARPKRPRAAEIRTLPKDLLSMCAMLRTVQREVLAKIAHCKNEPHDTRARRGLQSLIDTRASALAAIFDMDPNQGRAICADLNLTFSEAA